MPRKEDISMEERLERAKLLRDQKRLAKQLNITQLHGTKIYKLARKSCIVFLWVAQLIIIDWILPCSPTPEKIISGSMLADATYNKKTASRETYIWLNTQQYKQVEIIAEPDDVLPQGGDSVLILKSYLLRDIKKITDTKVQQTYMVTSALTYRMLPVVIIFSTLSLLFLFIENIEVKAFYYFMCIGNTSSLISLFMYYIL